MSKIAKRAGVSQATVSYVLNNRNNGISIRPETRQRILDTAAEMGYRRNDLARAMVTGKNFVLGFLTRTPADEGTARILVGAQEEANRHNYFIKLLPIPAEGEFRSCIERSMEQRLAGILAQNLAPAMLECLHAEAAPNKVPVVLVDDAPPLAWAGRVASDDELGIRQAVEHLHRLGHRHIAFVAAQENSALSRARVAAFGNAMREVGLAVPAEYIVWTDWHKAEVIETRVTHLLATTRQRPTALICAGDLIAMVALRAARAQGLSMPGQLSVVGWADFLMASFADPPLTTIAQPFEAMGRAGVRALLGLPAHDDASADGNSLQADSSQMAVLSPSASSATAGASNAPQDESASVLLPSQLVVRASTARPLA